MSRWAPSEEEFKARVAAFNRGEEAERKGNGSVFSIKTARSGAATTAVEAISIVVARDKAPPEPSIDQVPAFSDDWMALAFTKRHGIELRYCAQWSKWLIWDGTRWKIDETKEVFDRARKICREVAVECNEQKASKLLASSKTVAAVKTLAESDRQHAMTSDQWDADPRLLNTPGGTIDLCTGEMRAHSPDDYVTLTTACAWWRMSKLVRVS